MSLRYDTISFLSDYGRTDEFVGVVHSVIHQLCPGVRIVDVTHDVAPYDIRAAGLTLARSVQYLAPGVVMAVVDPGVGSVRRPIAVEVGDGASVLVGPDNGVLAPAVAMVGGATRAVWLNDAEHHLEAPGPLFDGRDVFAPVAARLCSGVPFDELGELIEPAGSVPGDLPHLRGHRRRCERRGALDRPVRQRAAQRRPVRDRAAGRGLRGPRRRSDTIRPPGAPLLRGGYRSARSGHRQLRIRRHRVRPCVGGGGAVAGPGDQLVLVPLDDEPAQPGVTTPVQLGRNP